MPLRFLIFQMNNTILIVQRQHSILGTNFRESPLGTEVLHLKLCLWLEACIPKLSVDNISQNVAFPQGHHCLKFETKLLILK